jgi:D-alanyl-D-alanine carboxypeptidase (penicillin-binding protein 5/6)
MKGKVRLKRLFIMIIIASFLLHITGPVQHTYAQHGVSAQAAILVDIESGRILFEKNSDQPLRIASITKIMTAIVAIENGVLSDKVVTSKNAYRVEGSSIYLRLGEKLSLEDMLYGLMLRSGNDAAVAIAEHIGGSLDGFIYLMNQKAEELGMTQSVFNNPHGLDDHEEHYSSARDMAVLTAYAMKNETFATIVGTKRKTAPLEGEKWDRIWHNKNRMLTKYPYADGVKTGFTKRAKRTLVSSATKDGHSLVAVTLNAPDDWNDHIHMFEYGFNEFTKVTLVEKEERLKDERLAREDGNFSMLNHLSYPLKEDEIIQKRIVLNPVFSHDEIDPSQIPYPAGYIHFTLDQKEIARIPIRFDYKKPKKKSFWSSFRFVVQSILGGR